MPPLTPSRMWRPGQRPGEARWLGLPSVMSAPRERVCHGGNRLAGNDTTMAVDSLCVTCAPIPQLCRAYERENHHMRNAPVRVCPWPRCSAPGAAAAAAPGRSAMLSSWPCAWAPATAVSTSWLRPGAAGPVRRLARSAAGAPGSAWRRCRPGPGPGRDAEGRAGPRRAACGGRHRRPAAAQRYPGGAPLSAAQAVGVEREVFACLLLDARHRLIGFEPLFLGSVDRASVHPREVLKQALAHNAAAVILAHNHPSGNPEPSPSDLRLTEELRGLLHADRRPGHRPRGGRPRCHRIPGGTGLL
jgi:DNA repair protein RadC